MNARRLAMPLSVLIVGLAVLSHLAPRDLPGATGESAGDSEEAGALPNSSVDADALSVLVEGTRRAVSSVKAGRGRVTVHERLEAPKGSVLETEEVYALAFSNNRYRLSVTRTVLRNDRAEVAKVFGYDMPGAVSQHEIAVDGRVMTHLAGGKATIGDGLKRGESFVAPLYRMHIRRLGEIGTHIPPNGLLDLAPVQDRLVAAGTETLGGSQCFIVEMTTSLSSPNGVASARKIRLWIDPEHGYTIPRVRVYTQGHGSGQLVLTEAEDCEFKEYTEGVWYPTRVISEAYRYDDQLQRYTFRKTEIAYATDFRINAMITDADLTLDLPSGTQVYDEMLDACYVVP